MTLISVICLLQLFHWPPYYYYYKSIQNLKISKLYRFYQLSNGMIEVFQIAAILKRFCPLKNSSEILRWSVQKFVTIDQIVCSLQHRSHTLTHPNTFFVKVQIRYLGNKVYRNKHQLGLTGCTCRWIAPPPTLRVVLCKFEHETYGECMFQLRGRHQTARSHRTLEYRSRSHISRSLTEFPAKSLLFPPIPRDPVAHKHLRQINCAPIIYDHSWQ